MSKANSSTSTNSQPLSSSQPLPQSTLASRYSFYSAYSPKRRVGIEFPEQGRTKQSFKAECDINNIMRRFQQTGVIDHLSQRKPMFGDMPNMDFQGAMAIVVEARERFAELPSAVRDRFANDPGRLLEFIQNPENTEEAIKLGLMERRDGAAKAPAAPSPVSPTGGTPGTPPSAS